MALYCVVIKLKNLSISAIKSARVEYDNYYTVKSMYFS
jgi:hypothetical protein